jgi:hypothetical protein
MNCEQVQLSLVEDLANRTEEQVARHLESCAVCRRVCDELLELEDLSRSLSGRFRVPATFQAEVLARAAVERPRKRRLRFALAAAVFVVISLGLVRPWDRLSAVDAPRREEPHRWAVSWGEGVPERDTPMVEVVIEGQEEPLILRLPSTIEIRRTDLREDFYIQNVSH